MRDGSDSDDGDCDSDTVPIVTVIVIAVVTEEEESGKVVHDKPMRRWVGHELEIIRWSYLFLFLLIRNVRTYISLHIPAEFHNVQKALDESKGFQERRLILSVFLIGSLCWLHILLVSIRHASKETT